MGTRCLLKPECWPLRSASGRQAPPAGPEPPEATPGRGWPSVTELQWPTHQDFAQTVPNAPSSQSPGPAPFALRPAASLTAGSLGAGPAVVGVVTNAVITTQQGSSEGQAGSLRSQPRRRGLPRPSPGHVSAPKHHESTDDSQTCGAPDPVPPRNGVRPVPRGAGTTETGLGSPRPSPPADSPAAPRGGPLTNTHDRPS